VRLEKAGHGDARTMAHSHDTSFVTGCCRDVTNIVITKYALLTHNLEVP
jgi:hypothetical protein